MNGDAESYAGTGAVGFGAEGAVLPASADACAAAGGLVAGDAAGGGDSGGGDCGEDGIHGEDGVPDGAGGTAAEHFAGAAGTDGAGGGVRPGVRAGSVGAVAGGSRDGVGGAGGLEETVYDAAGGLVSAAEGGEVWLMRAGCSFDFNPPGRAKGACGFWGDCKCDFCAGHGEHMRLDSISPVWLG